MPIETLRVIKVSEWPDAQGRPFSVFVIKTSGPTLTTLDPFQASLCERARETQQAIVASWRDHRRDAHRLVSVELSSPEPASVSGDAA